ncbi:MAG: 50S ribosomal protein L3 [Gemmatimonadaceae bacterium]|nr:50S ribosomal protein L3 [Gemmatimonadaceae bacterium]MCW5826080.1 50S ribosomal protein L3 [Gemmatimonadaceae bacterium]
MIGIIGKKLGMTQIFDEKGEQIPCTVVEATPNPVTKVVTPEAAGFASVELGYGAQRLARESKKGERTPKGRRANKAEIGHAKKAGLEAPPAVLRSFRLDDAPGKNPEVPTYNVGDVIKVDIFTPGEMVKVTGTTKGRGFQGVVKRHGFGGGPNTHGNTKHRRPGSIGPGTDPSRVIKGKKMPGHYGAERHTQINLRVEKVDAERNLIYIRGSVAGPTNGIVLVRKQG